MSPRRLGACIVRGVVAAILVAVLSALGLEALVRLSGRAAHLYTQPAFELSPRGDYWRYRPGFEGWVLGPTHVRIGPLGARLHASADAPSAQTRVAIFGDSITFGQAVEDASTFSAQLERTLQTSGHDVQVLNFGVQGHTVGMEVAHLADRLAPIQPAVVVLAFVTDDLNPEREHNHVDRFGYLTSTVFGAPSYWRDLVRAGLRQSHVALVSKDAWLRWRTASRAGPSEAAGPVDLDGPLRRFEVAIEHFDRLTADRGRIVACLDLRETPLTRAVRDRMRERFPGLVYVDATPTLDRLPLEALRVPRDGHPNARVHGVYAELLTPVVTPLLSAPHGGSSSKTG